VTDRRVEEQLARLEDDIRARVNLISVPPYSSWSTTIASEIDFLLRVVRRLREIRKANA
jgi:hypothetical protein